MGWRRRRRAGDGFGRRAPLGARRKSRVGSKADGGRARQDGAIVPRRQLTAQATSKNIAKSESVSVSIGGVAFGILSATAKIDDKTQTVVGLDAQLTAGGSVTLQATSDQQGTAKSSAIAGGGIGVAATAAEVFIDYDPLVEVKKGAKVTAGQTLTLAAKTGVKAEATSDPDSGGLGGGADGDTTIRIGAGGAEAATLVTVGDNVVLKGKNVTLSARVTGLGLSRCDGDVCVGRRGRLQHRPQCSRRTRGGRRGVQLDVVEALVIGAARPAPHRRR